MLKHKTRLNEIAIVDFGLATLEAVDEFLFRRCGTPGFVAPEIISNKIGVLYNSKCDIFSAGIIFYILYAFLVAL